MCQQETKCCSNTQDLKTAYLQLANSALRAEVAALEKELSVLAEEKELLSGIATALAVDSLEVRREVDAMVSRLQKQQAAGVLSAGKRLEKAQVFQLKLLRISGMLTNLKILLSSKDRELLGVMKKIALSYLSSPQKENVQAVCYDPYRELSRKR